MTVTKRDLGGRPSLRDGARRQHPTRGYWRVKVDGVWRFEHHLVMESLLGRPLGPGEEVRHTDANMGNNAPSNLELWVTFRVDVDTAATLDGTTDATNGSGVSPGIWTVPTTSPVAHTVTPENPDALRPDYLAYRRLYMREWRAKRKAAS